MHMASLSTLGNDLTIQTKTVTTIPKWTQTHSKTAISKVQNGHMKNNRVQNGHQRTLMIALFKHQAGWLSITSMASIILLVMAVGE